MLPLYFPMASEAKICQFYIGSDPLWAWVCSASDRQDAINELFKCVLDRCLFNHLGRLQEEGRRDREAESLGCLQVDDQVELRGLLHR